MEQPQRQRTPPPPSGGYIPSKKKDKVNVPDIDDLAERIRRQRDEAKQRVKDDMRKQEKERGRGCWC